MASAKGTLTLSPALRLMLAGSSALAQARYDDYEPNDHLKILLGGFQTQDRNQTVRAAGTELKGVGAALVPEARVDDAIILTMKTEEIYIVERSHAASIS